MLQKEAGKDPMTDRFTVGYLTAIDDLLNADIEETLDND